jgi:hypothetical protein
MPIFGPTTTRSCVDLLQTICVLEDHIADLRAVYEESGRPPRIGQMISTLERVLRKLRGEAASLGCCAPNLVTLTLRHLSAMYGVDTNRDGIFDLLFPDSGEGPAGIIAAADGSMYGSGERRLALVFDLSQIPSGSVISSAVLNLVLTSNQGGGNYELHGFANKNSVDLACLTVSNHLAGPFANYLPFPIDVSAFIKQLYGAESEYAGFSVRNVSPVGGIAYDGRDVQVRADRAPSLEVTFSYPC